MEIAQRQGRCITIEQLKACDLLGNRVTRAVRAGHVARVHPRVYVLGPARLTPDEALIGDPGAGRSHSEMERLFARLAAQLRGLPPYLRNHRLTLPDGRTVVPDAYFPDERAWIELDSRSWHQQRRAMGDDRRRDGLRPADATCVT